MANAIEKELITATKFKPAKPYSNRQDYLAALIKLVDKLEQPDFNKLSAEAEKWYNRAVEQLLAEEHIDDFPGTKEEAAGGDEPDVDDGGTEPPDEPVDRERQPVGASEGRTHQPESSDGEAAEAKEAKDEEPAKPKRKKQRKGPRIVDGEFDKDRFGVVKGTKTHEALKMYERGAKASEVSNAIGGKHYNIITRCRAEGHKVERFEDGTVKITHKDDVDKPAKGKKGK